MYSVQFRGEESARFTRFALEILECNLRSITVIVHGREPLTSRSVNIKGRLTGAKLDGYRRHVEITEEGSNMTYWIAGTNSTRSIAAQLIDFQISEVDYAQLQVKCMNQQKYIPGMINSPEIMGNDWYLIDRAPREINRDNLAGLLQLLNPRESLDIIREAVLDLRSYADIVASDRSLQLQCENKIKEILPLIMDRDCRIALVELIGYVGRDNMAELLGNILLDSSEDCHVTWAAAVAISRLSTEVSVDYLGKAYEQLQRDINVVAVSIELKDTEWVKAAVLLGMARHADENNKNRLESYFFNELDSSNQILKRYACLGLSKFNKISDVTAKTLVECLGDASVPIAVQGYVALALISNLDGCDDSEKEKIVNYLQAYTTVTENGMEDNSASEPEIIWGLEYMAELAALLEAQNVAASFHIQLSQLFDDWRRNYYKAVYFYEKGDSYVLQGEHDEALRCFCSATMEMSHIRNPHDESRAIISFRTDIINARLTLQRIIISWRQCLLKDGIIEQRKRMEEQVIAIYKRYRFSIDDAIDDKKLSAREQKYINETISILEIIVLFMQLDIECRNMDISFETIRNLLDLIYENLKTVKNNYMGSRGVAHFVDIAINRIEGIEQSIQDEKITTYSKIRSSRALVSEIKGIVSRTAWPMPARACPLGGLGKGTLAVKSEERFGDGTIEKPFVFGANSAAVINLFVTIEEMTPGGYATAYVEGYFGNKKSERIPIKIVEGSTMVSFILPDIFSSQVETKIEFVLMFESRDISQESYRMSIYAKKE